MRLGSPASLAFSNVGYVMSANGTTFAAVEGDISGKAVNLGVPVGGTMSEALGAYTSGTVVGFGDSSDISIASGNCCAVHALLWSGASDQMTVLPSLGTGDPRFQSRAYAVNGTGEIVGEGEVAGADGTIRYHAAVWLPSADNACANTASYCAYQLDQVLAAGSPTVTLMAAGFIDCEGDISAVGYPGTDIGNGTYQHYYLLIRLGPPRASCQQ